MDATQVLILVGAGVGGGIVAGLAGVGGGIVFAPVLFFFFQASGIAPGVIAPMTVATSLLCTFLASSMSAYQHDRRGVVSWKLAIQVGALSAMAMYVIVAYVTTEPWYDRFAFQLVFGGLLAIVAIRMWTGSNGEEAGDADRPGYRPRTWTLAGIGSAAGAIAGLAGVGGGIIMVPAFRQILRMSMREAIGTSSGSIVIISLVGLIGYVASGTGVVDTAGTLGYVNVLPGLILAIPGVAGAHVGAALAHRLPRRLLQILFAAVAGAVAVKMLVDAATGL